jgi:2-polyprenyl-6-methoxyphenol hydroxylase-like FAD-dependent oxidoreductase
VALHGGETLVLLICRSELLDGGPPQKSPRAALRRAFGDMKWEVPQILEQMSDVDDLYIDRVSQIHLPCWYCGRTALLGDAAACASLLAGEGTGLAMIEAYVLAGELNRFGRDVPSALASYEARLRRFVRAKQKSAVRFRGFFAPRTALGLAVRDLAVNSFALPFVGKRLITRAVRDELTLPDYENGESMQELRLPA